MRRLVISLLSLAAMAGGAHAANFIVVHHSDGTIPFWRVVDTGVKEAAAQVGATVDIRHPQRVDAVEEAQLLETAIAEKPDGIVVSIPDESVIGPVIKKAIEAGIPVVSINSGGDVARKYGVLFHVGQPELAAGEGAGKRAKELGVTKHLCILDEAANFALRQRCEGYAKGLGVQPNIVESTTDPAEIKARASAALSANPDVNGIQATGAHLCQPIYEAIVENGLEGKVTLSCFDLTPEVIDLIKSGRVAFSVDQQQYLQGYLPIIGLDLYTKYGLVPGGDVLSGPGFVTSENVDAVSALAGKYR